MMHLEFELMIVLEEPPPGLSEQSAHPLADLLADFPGASREQAIAVSELARHALVWAAEPIASPS